MKQFFSLVTLFISVTFFVVHSDSFTTAAVNNRATLSIISEENALISIDYTKDKKIVIGNNTDKTIKVKDIKLVSDPELLIINTSFPFSLHPGYNHEFTLATHVKEGNDNVIAIKVHWNRGSADIKSTIPKSDVELAGVESDEAYAKG